MSSPILFAGIDSGSAFTKVVIIDEHKNVLGYNIGYSGINLQDSAKSLLSSCLPKNANLSDIKQAIATGYGRRNIQISNISAITEISCSAKAANFLYPKKALTIIDIGGQDTKIIKSHNGRRNGFKMNRKCAAGTGSFLEELSLKLRIPSTELNELASRSIKPEKISSFCTVFAATEILSRIRAGAKIEDLILGAFNSVVKRVMEIDTLENEVVLTGGVIAHNPIIINIFEEKLGRSCLVPDHPQLFVALGASLYALDMNQSITKKIEL